MHNLDRQWLNPSTAKRYNSRFYFDYFDFLAHQITVIKN